MSSSIATISKLEPFILSSYERKSNEYAWTEGLQWHNGYLFESTGKHDNMQSNLNQLKLEEKRVVIEKIVSLSSDYFGEGLARSNNTLYQLTEYHTNVLRYSIDPFEKIGHDPPPEATNTPRWGLCFDNTKQRFYLSKGNTFLYSYTKKQFEQGRLTEPTKLRVTENNKNVYGINDLEYANGYIYAVIRNGECSNTIARINPKSGCVIAKINAENLRNQQNNSDARDLNGIAFYQTDSDGQDIFFVTGKLWSKIFKVKFVANTNTQL